MWTPICLTFGFTCLIGMVIYLAKQVGKNAEKAEALKVEIERTAKERARANKIIDSVRSMSADECRKWMQNNIRD